MQAPPKKRKKKEVRRQLDFAYACFALLGLTMLAFEAETFVDAKNQGAYAMTIGLLLLLPSMLAFVLAICLTVMRRRYRPIVVFCLLTMLLLALAIGNVTMAWIYGAVSMLVSAWWFTVGRWRNATPPRSLG
jgi:succinate-acetate transporter protein